MAAMKCFVILGVLFMAVHAAPFLNDDKELDNLAADLTENREDSSEYAISRKLREASDMLSKISAMLENQWRDPQRSKNSKGRGRGGNQSKPTQTTPTRKTPADINNVSDKGFNNVKKELNHLEAELSFLQRMLPIMDMKVL
ncbi:uncharacterized protein LOC130623996 [Hydractinia symbiolongicarpus]|uniref:uncharacterized protein LOC130623996 n=1 Tax=Hydractinia symbiolongicarpus TaxID=13093 RepID=UPI002549EAED|nr:uncharacterized protein LOC130623996 [Hydractinia symbiolongicarpus]